jgi:pilus assembly protein CpaC
MRRRILILMLTALAFLPAVSARAQTPPSAPASLAAVQGGTIGLEAGTGKIISIPAGIGDVFVADPKVAEVRPASPTSLFVFGTGPGHTTVAVVNGDGHITANLNIDVQPSSFNATSAAAAIARALPQLHIRVEAEPKGLMLTGTVPDPATAETAQGIAGAYLADGQVVDNHLTVTGLQQVGLRVRIAEMSRSLTNALGINWQALGNVGRFSIVGQTATVVSAASGVTPPSTLSIGYQPNVNTLDRRSRQRQSGQGAGGTEPDGNQRRNGQLPGGRGIPHSHRAAEQHRYHRIQTIRRGPVLRPHRHV